MMRLRSILLVICLAMSVRSFAGQGTVSSPEVTSDEVNVSEMLFGHIGDSYGWHITDWKGQHVTIPLPCIVYSSTRAGMPSCHRRSGMDFHTKDFR